MPGAENRRDIKFDLKAIARRLRTLGCPTSGLYRKISYAQNGPRPAQTSPYSSTKIGYRFREFGYNLPVLRPLPGCLDLNPPFTPAVEG